MYPYSLLPGDRLLVKKAVVIGDAITHSGTYMGGGLVAHISPGKGHSLERLETFADGQEVQVVKNGGIPESLLYKRFEMRLADPAYRLHDNNCEHLCNFLETGVAKSPQLQGGVAGFAGGVFVMRALNIQNPWFSLCLIALTTFIGVKIGAPTPQ